MTKWTLGSLVLCGFVIAGAAVQAHHSLAGVYSLGKEAKVHGTFNSFKIVNPHSSMKLDVKNTDGSVTEWSFVGGSATAVARLGLKDGPNALHFGENHGDVHTRGRWQKSGRAAGGDYVPGRAHASLPIAGRVERSNLHLRYRAQR